MLRYRQMELHGPADVSVGRHLSSSTTCVTMTYEDAVVHAKARAYDGYEAYVMRCRPLFTGDLMAEYVYTHVVSPVSREHHENAGWEVVETYPTPTLGISVAEVLRLQQEAAMLVVGK